ncbi:DUF2399 domain-containing protein [Actinokineospora auranticolor]|uniref:Uncharacterized protein (TIGR02679 family) n=1 Tax=Actinokineospora auranticolor TaxID=155976 RepID=A0A2S6GEB8_9PSEU|nr:TIGR02679 domain-containing protein [Actinokineospora auranticolor]PPK63426.1 uncharacterized protein (TIGR02679 family) [Actinokineospora auranticolor]
MTDPLVEFGRPEYEVLWRQARTAVARGQVKLGYKAPTPSAAAAVSTLLDVEVTAGVGRTIAVTDLDARLHTFGTTLNTVLSTLFGDAAATLAPVAPHQADDILLRALVSAGLDVPWAPQWADQARRYAKIPAEHLSTMATQAAAVLARLNLATTPPATWQVRTDLNPALTRGNRLTALVLRGAALAHNTPLPRTPADERRLWERCGVLPDAVSTTVLSWNFPGCEARTSQGLPTHLTIRDRVPPLPGVSICASPTTLDAAIAAGVTHPLLCVSGHLNPVARHILAALRTPRIHTDFDPHGLLIATQAHSLGATPWRLTANDYRDALTTARTNTWDLPPLDAAPPNTPWDPTLPEAMRAGWSIPEEFTIPTLLTDLT